MAKKRQVLIRCPRDKEPQFAVVADGIETKCHDCRGQIDDRIVHVDKEKILQMWADLAAGRPVLEQEGA